MANTKRGIRRILLEWMTGEQKPERPGYKAYAKMHRYKGSDAVVWVLRKKQTKEGK
jgi:hypothetical protein